MAAEAKILLVENMFEAARKAFFSAGDASPSAALPKSREIVFAKDVPNEHESPATPEATGTQASAVAQKREAEVLVHA
jgi:hypothetical protein